MKVTISRPTDFEVIKFLGSGSYGRVSQVKEKKSGLFFALKELIGTEEQFEQIRDIFSSEVEILSQISYPTLLSLHSISIGPPYFIFTEFCENGSVGRYIGLSYQGNQPDR